MKDENKTPAVPHKLMPATSHLAPADDVSLKPQQEADMASVGPHGYFISPPDPLGELAEFAEIAPDQNGRKATFLGELGKSLLNKFLGARKDEWEKLKADEREKTECAGKFRFYISALAAAKQEMDFFLSQVKAFSGINIAETIYKNSAAKGISINELFFSSTALSASQIFVAHLVKLNEKQLIAMAEEKYRTLADEFAAFKKEKWPVLKALGLV